MGGGHRTDSQLILDSVGDMVRILGGRTLSCDRGCRMAAPRSVETTQRQSYVRAPPDVGGGRAGGTRNRVRAWMASGAEMSRRSSSCALRKLIISARSSSVRYLRLGGSLLQSVRVVLSIIPDIPSQMLANSSGEQGVRLDPHWEALPLRAPTV